jgi:hypothetical protein
VAAILLLASTVEPSSTDVNVTEVDAFMPLPFAPLSMGEAAVVAAGGVAGSLAGGGVAGT